jgi:hypothetical protein
MYLKLVEEQDTLQETNQLLKKISMSMERKTLKELKIMELFQIVLTVIIVIAIIQLTVMVAEKKNSKETLHLKKFQAKYSKRKKAIPFPMKTNHFLKLIQNIASSKMLKKIDYNYKERRKNININNNKI